MSHQLWFISVKLIFWQSAANKKRTLYFDLTFWKLKFKDDQTKRFWIKGSYVQSNPYKMFAANFQLSWPSRPRTKGPLLFYFLKTLQFWFLSNFVGSTGSELQHPWISKIRCEPKKSWKKSFFRLNFEVLLINRSLRNFTWLLQFAWI